MSLLLLLVSVLGFVLFFYGIGLWYLAFLPLIFLGVFFWYYGGTQSLQTTWSELLQKYSLYIARTVILAGLVGVLNYFGMDITYITLRMLALNLFLRIVSYMVNYRDGKSIFQLGYYFSAIILLISALAFWGRATAFTVFSLLWILWLWVIAFFIFIVWIYCDIEKHFRYLLGVLSLGTIFLLVFDQIKNVYLAVTINALVLSWGYFFIYKILQHRPLQPEKKKEVSVRRILAGERITHQKTYFNSKSMELAYAYISTMPGRAKQVLELLNILLIFVLMGYYAGHIGDFTPINHIFYRAVITTFIANVILLKKVGYNSSIQNLVIFLVINFALYASLFSYFNGNVWSVTSRWIMRNVFSAGMIFYVHQVPMLAKIINKTDYIYWIVASVCAMIVNILLLTQTTLPGQLIFFLVLVYIGIQSMILYYAARYTGKIDV